MLLSLHASFRKEQSISPIKRTAPVSRPALMGAPFERRHVVGAIGRTRMHSAQQVVPIGERLVILAREFTDDTNETYLLAHKALRALLRADGQSLGGAGPDDLRLALLLAAKALGIAPADAVAPGAPANVAGSVV